MSHASQPSFFDLTHAPRVKCRETRILPDRLRPVPASLAFCPRCPFYFNSQSFLFGSLKLNL
jgi:hypothetical protein